MAKPIGRVWKNNGCMSGYIIIGPNQGDIIRFAFSTENGTPAFIFPKKEKDKETIVDTMVKSETIEFEVVNPCE